MACRQLEKELLLEPRHETRPGVQLKLLPQDGERYVFGQSHGRIAKERAMRKRHPFVIHYRTGFTDDGRSTFEHDHRGISPCPVYS